MEAVRSLGLAARFVSGYIYGPEADRAAEAGGGATHAWMQVYLPGAGWVDFDPTNSVVGNRNLIRVAVAWDHGHALPLWGTFTGEASSFLGMDVTVSVTDASEDALRAVDELTVHRGQRGGVDVNDLSLSTIDCERRDTEDRKP